MFRTSTALALALSLLYTREQGSDLLWFWDSGLVTITQQWDPEVVAHPTRKVISNICRTPDIRIGDSLWVGGDCTVSARPVGAECQCGKDTGNVVAK